MNDMRETQITKEQLESDFKKIGLVKGDHVAVTLSFKSIGFVEGGPDTFIDALLEVVGPEGTIMMNTFTTNYPVSAISTDFVFDSKTSIPDTGLVPRLFLRRDEVLRSKHPTFSVAAIGKMAEYLTEGHNENSNLFLPYEKLAKIDGKYLCIGIGNNIVAIRHEIQRQAGLYIVPKIRGVYYKDSEGHVKVFSFLHPPCAKNTSKLIPRLIKKGIIRKENIGQASCLLATANDLMFEMVNILKEKPSLNLCDNAFCWECRELEKRLGVRKKLNIPNFIQGNCIFRKFIEIRSETILRSHDKKYFYNLDEKNRIFQNFKYVFFWNFLNQVSRLSFSGLKRLMRKIRKKLHLV